MADLLRPSTAERDIDQAIKALKKGTFLLKYGRRGKPKFCPFRLSSDESALTWYYGKEEKQLELRQVARIIPGQRTAVFQRYPRPEKEYQSFSLIYGDRSLDVICKDKDEAEVWFIGLKALIAPGGFRKGRNDARTETSSCETPRGRKGLPSSHSFDPVVSPRAEPQSRLGKAFSDVVSYTAAQKNPFLPEIITTSPVDSLNPRSSADTNRASLSSAFSSSSQGSYHEDFDPFGDVFIWGEGTGEGLLGGGELRVGEPCGSEINTNVPKALDSTAVLDLQSVACGDSYAVLVTKQGEAYSWGEAKGGRLGHGLESDLLNPKLITALSGLSVEMVSCGDYHTCAVTTTGDLYSWGDGTHNCGLLGHGSEVSHWFPKKVGGLIEGIHVSYVSCGPWHTALISSSGQLFTFGEGSFGALGHGDTLVANAPREVESLKGLRTLKVACGVWHTAAVVEISVQLSSGPSDVPLSGNLFTWGSGDKGQLGHGDKSCRLVPHNVAEVESVRFIRVACGQSLTIALTTNGKVYTMGSKDHGQLGNPSADGKAPVCVKGKIVDSLVEEIACGSHHVAVLTSKMEVYTWGKGSSGQLGYGKNNDRDTPVLVSFLKDKLVRSLTCGSNFTAVICVHKRMTPADNTVCSSCRNPFNFRRKRHNCYNCGLLFCNTCSSRKSVGASLAPSMNKPYRVCDECCAKLQKTLNSKTGPRGHISRSTTMAVEKDGAKRLQHSDSFSLSEVGTVKSLTRVASSTNNLLLSQNGDDQRPKPTRTRTRTLSMSLPSSRMVSRSASPIQVKTQPLQPAAAVPVPLDVHIEESDVGDSKQDDSALVEEIKCLKAQVEELTSKSRNLEAELELKSRQLKEATEKMADEVEKSRSAKEVIKQLTSQLKEMAERLSMEEAMNGQRNGSRQSTVNIGSSTSSNGPSLPLAVRTSAQKPERVVQDEPGVYISLCSSPGGGNELRRVRFSRRYFSEERAETWWAEHGTKVLERHNIRLPT